MPPNILWILTTQWRAQATGYAGDPNARTPSLDALAARSFNFRQAVTPHPFGPFARAALLTGVSSPQNGVRDYYDPLPANASTIAHRLNDREYMTAFFGSWHVGRRDPSAPLVGEAQAKAMIPGNERGGFQYWEGFESGFLLNEPWLHGTGLPAATQFSGYQSDVVCGRAAAWIAECGMSEGGLQCPWFAVVSLEAPHPPYAAAAAGIAPADPASLVLAGNVPRGGGVEARARRELSGYYAHIEATDRAIGRLLSSAAELARASSVPPPAIVFTSVHGDMHGAHGLFRKGWPYEESVRVPLLVQVPGAAPEASDEPVSLVDLPAMTVALADAGASSRPARVGAGALLQGRQNPHESEISMPSIVARPDQCDRIWRGTRSRDRKKIFNADGSPWLEFDLRSDPAETKNLVAD